MLAILFIGTEVVVLVAANVASASLVAITEQVAGWVALRYHVLTELTSEFTTEQPLVGVMKESAPLPLPPVVPNVIAVPAVPEVFVSTNGNCVRRL